MAGVHLAYIHAGRLVRVSIRERPDRTLPFEVRWREEGRHRSRAFKTEKEAIRWEGKVAARVALGAHAPEEPSRIPLEEWTERWVDVYGPAWAERTRIQRADIIDHHVDPYIGGVKLRDLGRKRLVTYRRDLLSAGASAKTVNAVLRVLSACLKDAEEEGLIPANPLRGVKPLEEEPVVRRAIPLPVVRRLVAAMPTRRDRLIAALLCYAGLRPSEIRALLWSDIHPRAISIARAAGLTKIKPTKTGAVRAVPIRPELARVLKTITRGADNALVAPGERGGLLSWHNWSARVWTPARETVGVDYIPYEGRHTYASTLIITEGVDPVQVSRWMGHSKPSMTLDTYSHLFTLRDSSRELGVTTSRSPHVEKVAGARSDGEGRGSVRRRGHAKHSRP